jgi:hypothetical protein
MSDTPPAPPPIPPVRKFAGGQIAMIVIGVILLLPGLCSLFFVVTLVPDFNAKALSDPISQMIFTLWGICFAVSALGVWLIVAARKRARIAP